LFGFPLWRVKLVHGLKVSNANRSLDGVVVHLKLPFVVGIQGRICAHLYKLSRKEMVSKGAFSGWSVWLAFILIRTEGIAPPTQKNKSIRNSA